MTNAGAVQEDRKVPPSWATRFVGVCALTASFSLVSAFVLSSYFDFRPLELISFTSQDGWCSIPEESFGSHCFGDHSIIREYLRVGDFWGPRAIAPAPYPPLAVGIHALVHEVGMYFGGLRGSYLLFLALALASLLTPAIWAMRSMSWPNRALVFFVLGIASAPVMINLDRGQLTSLIVPLVLGFCVSFLRKKYWVALAFCTAAACLKPQFVLMALAFLAVRRFIWPLIVVTVVAAITGLSFFFTPGDPLANAENWAKNVLGYGQYSQSDQWYPVNLSLGRAIAFVGEAANPLVPGLGDTLTLVASKSVLLSGFAVMLTIVALVLARPNMASQLTSTIAVVTLTVIAPGTSFSYYSALILPLGALILRSPAGNPLPSTPMRGSLDDIGCRSWLCNSYGWILLLTLGAVLFPVAIPLILFGMGTNSESSSLIPGAWGVLVVAAWLATLWMCLRGPTESSRV